MDKSRNKYLDEITSLEETINSAIELIERYEIENTALKQKMESLTLEKSLLLQKNDQAKTRLESMITRLKSLEQQSV
jgi:cell division protein ZapB